MVRCVMRTESHRLYGSRPPTIPLWP